MPPRAEKDEARAGRVKAFREDTREQRMEIAREAERRYERKVSWGVRVGEYGEMFTHLAAPVMTRLRQPQRQVLDTLVDAGVARSRSEALAWCVRLVGQHEDDWLAELREAMSQVAEVRHEGPGGLSHCPGSCPGEDSGSCETTTRPGPTRTPTRSSSRTRGSGCSSTATLPAT